MCRGVGEMLVHATLAQLHFSATSGAQDEYGVAYGAGRHGAEGFFRNGEEILMGAHTFPPPSRMELDMATSSNFGRNSVVCCLTSH